MLPRFSEFVDKKQREARRQLRIVKDMLEKAGFEVEEFIETLEDPHIFVKTPKERNEEVPFEGIRIYRIGKMLAYRVQNESKTEPYGKAYALDIEGMFDDMVSDHIKEDEAGKAIVHCVAEQLKRFFKKSSEAEKELRGQDIDKERDPLGRVVANTTGTDYANMVQSKVYP